MHIDNSFLTIEPLMIRFFSAGLIMSGLLIVKSDEAAAISLSLTPPTQEVELGNSIEFDLVVSDLGNFTSPSVSAFSLDIGFDPNILSLNDLVFGNALDLGLGLSFQSAVVTTTGTLGISEFSLVTPSSVLDALQPSDITLATLTFETIGVGSTSLSPNIYYLGDAIGDPLLPTLVSSSEVTVKPIASPPDNPESIPLPGGAWITATVLISKGELWRRRRHSSSETAAV